MSNFKKKRILFVISSQHLNIAGGIGQFLLGLKGFEEELGAYIDICTDVAPKSSQLDMASDSQVIYPDSPIKYSIHNSFFVFKEGINQEKVVNFSYSIQRALLQYTYDLIILNTPESMYAAYGLGVHKFTRVYFYTHHEKFSDNKPDHSDAVFTEEHLKQMKHMAALPSEMKVAAQTEHSRKASKAILNRDVEKLPFFFVRTADDSPLPETERDGLLFIGRWDARKRPREYVRAVAESGLRPRVMTNPNGQKKFEKAFAEAGIKDYDIVSNVSGQEKADFIRQSLLAFLPYAHETGPYAAFEALAVIPTLALKGENWSEDFAMNFGLKICAKSEVVEYLNDMVEVQEAEGYQPKFTFDDLNRDALNTWSAALSARFGNVKPLAEQKNGIAKTVNGDDVLQTSSLLTPFNQTSLEQLYRALNTGEVEVLQSTEGSYIIPTSMDANEAEDKINKINKVDDPSVIEF